MWVHWLCGENDLLTTGQWKTFYSLLGVLCHYPRGDSKAAFLLLFSRDENPNFLFGILWHHPRGDVEVPHCSLAMWKPPFPTQPLWCSWNRVIVFSGVVAGRKWLSSKSSVLLGCPLTGESKLLLSIFCLCLLPVLQLQVWEILGKKKIQGIDHCCSSVSGSLNSLSSPTHLSVYLSLFYISYPSI